MHALLDPLLVQQHGTVARRQALDLGMTSHQVNGLLSRALLVPVFTGVYRDPAAPVTTEQRAMAAVLLGGNGTLVSHRQAVAIHGMRNYACKLAEITAVRRIQAKGLTSHRAKGELELATVNLIPCTTPARTLLDCATVLGEATVRRFGEIWLSTGVVTIQQLDRERARSFGHHGLGVLSRLIDTASPFGTEPDSPAELALGQLLIRHGLPAPILHHLVTVASGAVFELDWSYPDEMVALEMDGYGIHLRSRDAFDNDRLRRNELEINGWQILNFTQRILQRSPKRVIGQVQRALDARRVLDLDAPTVNIQHTSPIQAVDRLG